METFQGLAGYLAGILVVLGGLDVLVDFITREAVL